MLMVEVMHSADLSVGARLLWWELNHSWVAHGVDTCFPTQRALAKVLGVSRSSIVRWLQELVDKGVLKTERQQRGNKYTLTSSASSNSVSSS
jgi:DNA-binding MarR family transcriptional regulator